MKKSVLLKKFLTFIMASSSIIFIFTNQICMASGESNLKFCSDLDKEIFVETYNNMLSYSEGSEPYKDKSSEFTFGDYYKAKDYILYTDDYDSKGKEDFALICVRTFLNTKNFNVKSFFKRRFLLGPSPEGVFFESNEEKTLFLNFYNVMCFCKNREDFAALDEDKLVMQDLEDLRNFYNKTCTFYTKEYIHSILNVLGRISYYNGVFLKKLS